jgi:hypothetical protein
VSEQEKEFEFRRAHTETGLSAVGSYSPGGSRASSETDGQSQSTTPNGLTAVSRGF